MGDKLLDSGGDPESKQDFYNFLRSKNLPRTGAMYAEEANLQPKPEAAENEAALMLGTGSESVPLTAERVYEYLMRDNRPDLAIAFAVNVHGAGDYNPVGNQAFTSAPGPSHKRRSIPDQYHKEEISRSSTRQRVDRNQRHPPAQRSPVEQLAPNRRPDQASSSRVPSMGSSPNERHYWGQLAPAAGGGNSAMVPQARAGHPMESFQSQEQHHWNQLALAAGGGNPAMVPQAQAGHPMESFRNPMVPQAQGHFRNPPSDVGPSGFRMTGIQLMVTSDHYLPIGSSYCVSYDGMPPLSNKLPQAQAGHPMMVPRPEIGSSSSQQIHFTNAPRNVDPAGSRTAVGEANVHPAPSVLQDPNQQLEAVNPNQQLEAVIPTTAPNEKASASSYSK